MTKLIMKSIVLAAAICWPLIAVAAGNGDRISKSPFENAPRTVETHTAG